MWKIFKVINFFYLLISGYAWFGFLLPGQYIPILVSLAMIVCYALGNFNLHYTPRFYALLGALVLYSLWGVFILGMPHGLLMFMSYLPAVLIFILDERLQKDLLSFVTKWVCIMLCASLFFFMVSFFIDLPHRSFMPAGMERVYSSFENYGIFIKRTGYTGQTLNNIVRFCGPFLEPGHLSMVCGLLLFANGYRLKENPLMWILVVSILVSLSLAGYIILLAGLCMMKLRNVVTITALVTIIFGAWLSVAVLWNGGQNPVNIMIFERLELDDSKGIKGNNRTIAQTDYYYKRCIEDGTIWYGVRTQKVDNTKIVGAGYKIYLLRYGIISLVFVTALYLLLIVPGANKRYARSFFVLMIMLFMQRAYPWGYSWLFPYVLGIGISRGKTFFELSKGSEDEDLEVAPEIQYDWNTEDADDLTDVESPEGSKDDYDK